MKKEDVFEDLRSKIVRGELSPGQWLVERDLSEIYHISRTPIRENLRNLAILGIVESEPSKGYRVKKLTVEEIIEIFNARASVEGECARLACLTKSTNFPKEINALKEQLEAIDILENSSQGVAVGADIHAFIVKTANNRYLTEFYQKLTCLAALIRNMTKNSALIEQKSKDAHLKLLLMLGKRDAVESRRYMRVHLRSTCKALVESYLDLPGIY